MCPPERKIKKVKKEILAEAMSYVSAYLGSSVGRKRAEEYIAAKYSLSKEEAEEAVSSAYSEWASAYE